jgi:AraC-like DNA-binding protein
MAGDIKSLAAGDHRQPGSGRTVSAGLAAHLVTLAASKGANIGALLHEVGLAENDLRDQDGRIPYESYVALARAAIRRSEDPALALHYGASVHMSEFSVAGLLFQTCESVRESIDQINRFGELIVETDKPGKSRFDWVHRDGKLWLVDTRRNPNDFPELTEATFARFISMTRGFWPSPLVDEVHVTHAPPAHFAEYERVFGAPTRFAADWNAMSVDEARINDPIRQQPRYAFGILSEHAEALLAKLQRAESTRARLEALIMPVLHKGEANLEHLAAGMGLSRQTLYRRLKQEGLTFEKVLDDLRHRLALDYLRGARVSISEIAFLVGFSDAASFSRAFKRWTGTSPGAARVALKPGIPIA